MSHDCILKNDFFPGSQKKTLVPQIEGAPNYVTKSINVALKQACRESKLNPTFNNLPKKFSMQRKIESVNVYGTGIPTKQGMFNVLSYLKSTPEAGAATIWICLREG